MTKIPNHLFLKNFGHSNIGDWNYLENKFVTPTPPSPLGGGGDGGGIFIVRR